MRILLTAFEPFGGAAVNASQEALKLVEEDACGAAVIKLTLPVVFGLAGEQLTKAIRQEQPDAVLCLGEAGGRKAITPERIAVNLMDARIPDNAGAQPQDEPIDPDGPAAIFSTLPLRRMMERIREAGLPAALSLSAGSFVCNDLMYRLLRFCEKEGLSLPAGFMHLPLLDTEGLDAKALARGVEAAVRGIKNPSKNEVL